MKIPAFAWLLVLGVAALAAPPAAHAQVNVNVQLGRPAWGPAVPRGAQYYYIPEIDGYYDLYTRRYLVFRGGRWLPVATLAGYNPYSFHPVVVTDYRGREPWRYVNVHRARYRRPVVVVRPAPRPVVVRPVVVRPVRPIVVRPVRRVVVRPGRDRR